MGFEKYKCEYQRFTLSRSKSNNIVTLLDDLTYNDLCECLEKFKHSLFGLYVSRYNFKEIWIAKDFIRYETNINF